MRIPTTVTSVTVSEWQTLRQGTLARPTDVCPIEFIKKETLYSVSFFMFCYASLALAMSHRAVNATASLMAISDSILRLIWTPASFRPCMKVE